MDRIDFDKLAKDYNLIIEKHDYGRYGQWKNAKVYLFLPDHIGGPAIICGVIPPDGACTDGFENLSLWSKLAPDYDGILRFHRHECICNDDFNEHYIREVIEQELKTIEKGK